MAGSNKKEREYRYCVLAKHAAAMLLVVCFLVQLLPTMNFAGVSAQTPDSGICGGCSWSIDGDGVLVIEPTDGVSGVLESHSFASDWGWGSHCDSITRVIVRPGVKGGKNTKRMFFGLSNCIEMDVGALDITGVEDMGYMFTDCESLTGLDLSEWDTSEVIGMGNMFSGCSALTEINLSGWDTSNVRNMYWMFAGCESLAELDVSGFDTSAVRDVVGMFANCSSLEKLDVSGFDISGVEYMYRMFSGCSSLTELDVSGFDTSAVKDMVGVFADCSRLKELDVSGWDTSSVSVMNDMFTGCESLTGLDISGWDASGVTEMNGMFSGCSNLVTLDLSGFNMSGDVLAENVFGGCSGLKQYIVCANWDSASDYNMETLINAFDVVDGTLFYRPCGEDAVRSVTIHDGENDIPVDLNVYPDSCPGFTGDMTATIVFGEAVAASGISLSAHELELPLGAISALSAAVTPADSTDRVKWSSSDESVVTAANGKLTAVGVGTATVTAAAGEYSDSCVVTVTAAEINYSLTPAIKGAASKLYEPWGLKYFASYDGDDVDKITERGVVMLKDEFYTAGMTPEAFRANENAYDFSSARDELGFEAPSAKYPNGRYTALLDEGIYSYDISAAYYALPYAVMENGQIVYGAIRNISMEQVLNSNLSSSAVSAEEKTICTCILALKESVATYYSATGIQGASVDIHAPRGSSQTAASKVMTPAESGITPAVKGAASRLIEPWGLKFTAAYTADSRIADRGIVMLREDSYSAAYASNQDAMRLNAEAYVFTEGDETLQYVASSDRYSALLTEGISSRDISAAYYAAPFVVLNDGTYVYGTVRSISMLNILNTNLSSSAVSAEEKAVCQDIIDLYNAVKAFYEAE